MKVKLFFEDDERALIGEHWIFQKEENGELKTQFVLPGYNRGYELQVRLEEFEVEDECYDIPDDLYKEVLQCYKI